MLKLFKNTTRSFKENKLSLIGITFLVFLSFGIFGLLNSTEKNISYGAQKIYDTGQVHDFTINESYATGNYKYNISDPTDGLQSNAPFDWVYTVQISAPADDETTLHKFYYDMTFSLKNTDPVWENVYETYYDFEIVTTGHSVKASEASDQEKNEDAPALNALLSNKNAEYYNFITTSETPTEYFIEDYNNSSSNKDKINYREFNSIDFSTTGSNPISFKFVESNPEDEIDKIVLSSFDGNPGNELFSTSDSQVISDNWWNNQFPTDPTAPTNEEIITYPYSSDVAQWTNKQQMMFGFRSQMLFGGIGFSLETNDTYNLMKQIVTTFDNGAGINSQEFISACGNYVTTDYLNEKIVVHDSNINVTWYRNDAPFISSKVNNWTQSFVIATPQYCVDNNLRAINEDDFLTTKTYSAWYADGGKELASSFKERVKFFFNSLSTKDSQSFLSELLSTPNASDFMVMLDEIPIIVWGIGMTPDFVYPMYSFDSPSPDSSSQCIMFSNTAGLEAADTSFTVTNAESYFVAKSTSNNASTIQKEIDAINKNASVWMTYPDEISACYHANDSSNFLNSSGLRMSYIDSTLTTVSAVNLLMSSLTISLSMAICIIIIAAYVKRSRTSIGVMLANGFKKTKIAFSLFPLAAVPALVGGLSAYIMTLLLQKTTLALFSSYWLVPTTFLSFDFVTLLFTIVIPLLLFAIVTFLTALYQMREKPSTLMKQGSEFKVNIAAKIAKRAVYKTSPITKFRTSLAFNSILKLSILSIMMALSISVLNFDFATFNKMSSTVSTLNVTHKYKYAIDLQTPTDQGGQYVAYDYYEEYGGINSLGQDIFTNKGINQTIYNINENPIDDDDLYTSLSSFKTQFPIINSTYYENFKTTKGSGNEIYSNVLIPSVVDASAQKENPLYLKNQFTSELTLNYNLGLGGLTSNPWNIAISSMPLSQFNAAESGYEKTVNYLGRVASTTSNKDFFIETSDVTTPLENKTYVLNFDNIVKGVGTNLDTQFIQFIVSEYLDNKVATGPISNDFTITYNMIPLAPGDETYTYLSGYFEEESNESKIVGIQQNSQYINLLDDSETPINNLLFQETDGGVPCIINKYVAFKYNLFVGDTFEFNVNNSTNRYSNKIENKSTLDKRTFKVVGIDKSSIGNEIFISQDQANLILGITNKDGGPGDKMSDWIINNTNGAYTLINMYDLQYSSTSTPVVSNYKGFNGVFTKNDEPKILTTLPLYSPSGIYMASGFFNADALDPIVSNSDMYEIVQDMTGVTGTSNSSDYDTEALIPIFGNETYFAVMNNVLSLDSFVQITQGVADSTNVIQTTLLAIIIPTAGIIILMISSIIIYDTRKLAALLKTLGYSDTRNILSFAAIYIPTIIIGIVLAIPLSIGILHAYQMMLFNSAAILIDVSLPWYYYGISTAVASTLLGVSTLCCYGSLKKKKLIEEIK